MGLLAWLGLRRRNQWESLTLLDHLLASPLTFLTTQLYHLMLLLRGAPFHPPRGRPPIRVVCISDTHDAVVDVPPGDVLIHAGDLTNDGSAAHVQRQLDWLKGLPHSLKVVVAGNHDSYFDPRSRSEDDVRSGAKLDLDGLVYLEGELTVQDIKGRSVAIFGAPDIPECGPKSFAFQYSPARQPWLSKVPPQTDILVTHGPPKHHRDLGVGCPHLLREVWRVKPRLHVFGHTHCAYGKESVYFDDMQVAYERLLSRPRRGLVWDLVPNQAWVDMLQVLLHGVHSVLWKWLMGGPGSNQGSLMVNAAQMYKNTGRAKSRAIVVDI
ncbi:putative rhamnogalacturonate lyase C [Tolypocladium ophioglossoides CBS 100239]|uniref:Putative rhamnogalacturonate lyase C n=1 Tax=Tolypocladium ophioglossoides (strain CBS 100239) TaxID=1163406 RepID=A0A0L0N445_TOLOC|nr:putative rhamnogalacturonate lyase C [Tolypocladium ophioglossoides CBS 100239]